MLKILTLNTISPRGLDELARDAYEVASEIDHPDAVIVRSHDMHAMTLPETVKAIARAGAGVNNIPVEDCSRRGIVVFNMPGANANSVKEKTLWNYLSRNRLSSIIWGIPLTYPPKPLNGMMVSSFLTPDKSVQWTYPEEAAAEIDSVADGDYIIDVKNFRTDDKDWLLEQIRIMTERRFKAFRHFYKKEDPDFAMMVEMGPDRIHHGFWRYMDKNHRLYEAGHKYEHAIHDYYLQLDEEVGRTLEILPDNCEVMIVSDHGAKTMIGGFCTRAGGTCRAFAAFAPLPPLEGLPVSPGPQPASASKAATHITMYATVAFIPEFSDVSACPAAV
jgi:hypothetical protein